VLNLLKHRRAAEETGIFIITAGKPVSLRETGFFILKEILKEDALLSSCERR
jgi:hypothetical protein